MANEENIRQTVEVFDPKRWNQESFFSDNECGTTGCLAGWGTMVRFPEKFKEFADWSGFEQWLFNAYGGPANAAQEFFGLTNNQREFLFYDWTGQVLPDGFDWEGYTTYDDVDNWYDLQDQFNQAPVEYTVDNLKRTLTMVTGVTFE